MKCDDNQKWYMAARWEKFKCNNEEYSWDDEFTWGNKCDYNDGFKWKCKENKSDEMNLDCKSNDNQNTVTHVEKVKDIGNIDELSNMDIIEDIDELEEVDIDDDEDDIHEDDEDDNDGDTDDEIEDDEDIDDLKNIKSIRTVKKKDENITLNNIQQYVDPMKYVLTQLMNADVNDLEVGTERQGTLLNCRIVGIDNSLMKIQTDYNFALIPIGEIIGIYSRKIKDVTLIELSEESYRETEDEKQLTEYILNKIGKAIRINTSSNDELFRSVYGTVTSVGKGTVMLSNKVIIPINKIIYVEEDF